ncbi:MAG TPA: oligoribonuclease [Polyangiaceae bacterium]
MTIPADRAPPERRQDPRNLAWLDLEMTGLDVETCVVLQAALVVTDAELNILEEYACDVWQPERALAEMVPIVRQMHQTTGLLERVRGSSLDVGMAERELLERVAGWCSFPAVLCGNTIASDRRFVERYMPGLGRYLHYRMVDVSAVKVLAGLWYGDGAVFKKPERGKHDALVDVRNSIAELAHYRKSLFRQKA